MKSRKYKADDETAAELDSKLGAIPSPFFEENDVDDKTTVSPPKESVGTQGDNIILKKIEAGTIGKCIGTGENASRNILLIIFLTLMLFYLILLALNNAHLDSYWAYASNLITLSLGYMFGKGKITK